MLTQKIIEKIIKKILKADNYRIEIITLIDAEFLQFVIEFFKKVAEAKLNSKKIDSDWYKETFLHDSLSSEEIAIHSGLNKKNNCEHV